MVEPHSELEHLLDRSPFVSRLRTTPGENIDNTQVFPIIHMIRSDVVAGIDVALSYEALTAPGITDALVRPLARKYSTIQRQGNLSVVFCLLLNRVHFLRDGNSCTLNLSGTRGMLCEILAVRVLREIGNDIFRLTNILTLSWSVYDGADPEVIARAELERDSDLEYRVGNAIELAVLGKAREFIKSYGCQQMIKLIWSGKWVYQAQRNRSILSDTYKRNPMHFYDPHKAPLLDHYRLKVPAIRSVLEYTNFLILFILFIIAVGYYELNFLNAPEILFMVYALGFGLEKIATMQEHGIKVYFYSTWNGFDLAFMTIYSVYVMLRLYGVYGYKLWARELGIDFLAIAATLMFPRLAFVTLKNNFLVLSLRAMFKQFLFLTLTALFCLCGFAYGLWTLNSKGPRYAPQSITWWMSYIYFGLDATGFAESGKFHPLFGPILWVTFGFLSNTFLTIVLVSVLSNTFARMNEVAEAETIFMEAVSVIESVKADSIFSYQPPINVLALCIMLPARYLLSPRWFHKVNVFLIRVTNFPILLLITLYERQAKEGGTMSIYDTLCYVTEKVICTLPRPLNRLSSFEGLAGPEDDIDAIFEIGPEYTSALDTNVGNAAIDAFLGCRHTDAFDPSPPIAPMQSDYCPPSPTPSQHPSNPRLRLDSDYTGPEIQPQSFTSPLEQMYSPVAESVLEGHPKQPDMYNVPTNGSRAKAAGVPSSSPTRRRMTSAQSLGQRHTAPNVPTELSVGVDFDISRKSSTSRVGGVRRRDFSLSSSVGERRQSTGSMRCSDQLVYTEELEEPATVSEIRTVGGHSDHFDPSDWNRRLQENERRQARMEDLLERIAAVLKVGSSEQPRQEYAPAEQVQRYI